MSLTDFVERPAIRAAFKAHAARVQLPPDVRMAPMLVPSTDTKLASAVGTAFDYLARFRVARDLVRDYKDVDFVIRDDGWVAQHAVHIMRGHPEYSRWHSRWGNLVEKARELLIDFIEGRVEDMRRIAICCQYMGAADMLIRTGRMNPGFAHKDIVTRELLALDAIFEPSKLFHPQEAVLLNPTFKASGKVGGADADLIVDDLGIDIKTTIDFPATPKAQHLRQVAGYAVLQSMGGALADGGFHIKPFREVALYFSRHGILAKWRIDELFPADGFQRFADTFRAEMTTYPMKAA